MKSLRYTLLSDGSSDRMLMPVLDWLLHQHCPECAVDPYWADLGRLPQPPRTMPERIRVTLEFYPCDILFIHRDAEKESYEIRHDQITRALVGLKTPPTICVIPIRMQEAWLLFDQAAIRRAAGNPNGHTPINLPDPNAVEKLPDPKQILFNLILQSSGLKGARLKRVDPRKRAFIVSQSIDDFSPLRSLSAFRLLEQALIGTLRENGWAQTT